MSKWLLGVATALLLGVQSPAYAEGDLESELDKAERLARQGAAHLLRALETFVDSIPQYEVPEVLPNGDIIIRRKPDEPDRPAPGTERPSGVITL